MLFFLVLVKEVRQTWHAATANSTFGWNEKVFIVVRSFVEQILPAVLELPTIAKIHKYRHNGNNSHGDSWDKFKIAECK